MENIRSAFSHVQMSRVHTYVYITIVCGTIVIFGAGLVTYLGLHGYSSHPTSVLHIGELYIIVIMFIEKLLLSISLHGMILHLLIVMCDWN